MASAAEKKRDKDCQHAPGAVSALREKFEDACFAKDEKAALELIKKGLLVNEVDENGNTPLSLAVRAPMPAVARRLIEQGGGVNAKTKYGTSVLSEAVLGGDGDTVALLLERGADMGFRGRSGDTALTLAAARGNLEIVKLLLAAGASPREKRDDGTDGLFIAAQRGHPSLVRYFAEAGCQVNAYNADGLTPLLMTSMTGDPATAQALIKAGADVNLVSRDRYRLSPLAMAAGRKSTEPARDYPGVLRELVAAGARLDLKDGNGRTPLEMAAAAGLADRIPLLLPKLEGNPLPEYVANAFRESVEKRHYEAVKIFLSQGLEVPALPPPPKGSLSVVFFTIQVNADSKMLKILLEGGANPNETRNYLPIFSGVFVGTPPEPREVEESALIAAVRAGSVAMVELLVKAGASTDWRDSAGMNALDWAKKSRKGPIIRALKRSEPRRKNRFG